MTTHASTNTQNSPVVRWFDWPAMVIFIALMLIVFTQFFTRYFLNDSLSWTEEIARFLLIGLVFSGSISLVARGEHIFLEVIHRLAPRPNTKPLALGSEIIGLLYYVILAVFSLLLALQTDQNLISIALPKAVIYGFIALTMITCVVFAVLRLTQLMRKSSDAIYQDIDQQILEEA